MCKPHTCNWDNWNNGWSNQNVFTVYKHARLGGSGGMLPQEVLKLLLRPFWNRSRAAVATWLAEYCIQVLAVHVSICEALEFPRKKVHTNVGRTAGRAISLEGQLLSTWTSDLFMQIDYLHASFHHSGINSLRTHSTLVLHEQTCIVATRLVWTVVILNSSETSHGRTLKMYS